ncbi:MAG: TyeA family type III secretion system gatekeeper subunit [Puniceicoccales bacterium]|jgi:type III secretion system TyeA family effector delivery regulator|nr:TyeA family type III secretion system gatekeeper subunit [Puniceicoccales bacterium]
MTLSEEKLLSVTRNVLRAVQGSSVGISNVEGILQDFDIPNDDIEARIFILSRLAELVRELPLKTFRSADHRFDLIDIVQEVLDHYIEVEDIVTDEVS